MSMKTKQLPDNTQSNTCSNPQWYVLQTFSRYESKAKLGLERMIENYGLHDQIPEIRIVTEKTVKEYANGKKKTVERNLMPNYIFVKLVYSDQLVYLIRNVRGILGFVATTPMLQSEVRKLHLEDGSDENFSSGDQVVVVNGVLAGFTGVIRACDASAQTATVAVTMFQREKEVDFEYVQLQKLCA